jgi:hypothetical protein
MPTAPTPVPAHTTPIQSTADRASYGTRGRALYAYIVNVFVGAINSIANNVYANALEAEEAADAALATAGAALWNPATNYATGAAAISPTDLQTYRRASPGGVNATDPAASALWTEVGFKRVAKAGDTGLGTMQWANDAFVRQDDMRWAPIYKKGIFQSSFANSGTNVGARPNGSGSGSSFYANNASPTEFMSFAMDGTGGTLEVGKDASVFGDVYRDMFFRVGNALRMTFAANGNIVTPASNFLMGATAFPANVPSGLFVSNGISAGGFRSHAGIAGAFTVDAWNLHWNGSAMALWVGTTNVGNLTISSDHRIKTDVAPMPGGALARVALLRPVTYRHTDAPALNFTAQDQRQREGFLAHELADVVPSAVDGGKDEEGRIQSLRLDPVVALLTKAVQELTERVNALEAAR